MTALGPGVGAGARGPRPNVLQRLWLRELGIEKIALPHATRAAPQGISCDAAVQAAQATVPHAVPQAAPQEVLAVPSVPAPAAAARRPGVGPRSGKGSVLAPAVPLAQAVDLSGTDLDALREQVVGCTLCGLCQGRRNAVFGDGALPAKWMVVGEAPGEQEDRQASPFVGRSGQLLKEMLQSVGMSRQDDVFISNVIKCRPPGNRNPKPEEVAACSPYLLRQVDLIKPEKILVLGRFAAQALVGSDATIGQLRGRTHFLTTPAGMRIPMVVSYHPAYLLRSPVEKARAWHDLQLAAQAQS